MEPKAERGWRAVGGCSKMERVCLHTLSRQLI